MPTLPPILPLLAGLALTAALAAGCAPPRSPEPPLSGTAPSALAEGIMPALGELPVLVLPVQRVAVDGGLDWTPPGGARATLRMADSLINDVLVMRGAGSKWQFAEDARRAARRNPTYVSNPDALAVSSLNRLAPGDPLPEPLASELRTLVAMGDARHVLLPVELRGHAETGGEVVVGRAVLIVAVMDARLSQLLWIGPVMGEPAPEFTAAAVESAVAKLADLIVAR